MIKLPVLAESFREYLIEFQDFHLAYYKDGGIKNGVPVPDPENAINPPAKQEENLPINIEKIPLGDPCPDGRNSPPCPEAISAADPGTMTVNYRNEPIALRVWNPATRAQTVGAAGDLSMAFRSNVTRALPELNQPPSAWAAKPLSSGVLTGDPATPLMRAYQKDNVKSPSTCRRARRRPQLQHQWKQVVLRAESSEFRLPQQPDDGHLRAFRIRDASVH